jgi:hypothetical protein
MGGYRSTDHDRRAHLPRRVNLTYDAFRSHIQTRLGNCASRAIVTEYGAPMSTGLNYGHGEQHRQLRPPHPCAVTQVMRDNQMGGTYWPALGGKPTGTSGFTTTRCSA